VNSFIRQLWALCLLRAGPQDMPAQPQLATQLIVALVLLQVGASLMLGADDALAARMLLSVFLLVAPVWWLLGLKRTPERLPQTLTALAGTSLLISLIMLPLSMLVLGMPPPTAETPPTGAQMFAALVTFGLLAWKLSIDTHIWRNALDIHRGLAMVLALVLFVGEIALNQLFPGA
jgi:hypothetical protein